MGKVFEAIDERLRAWVSRQALFFVGTAPLAADGHVNLSPKGPIGSLRILGEHRLAYLDMIGSGAETIAHLRENGRIVVMLCAFEGAPRIVRFHGTGRVLLPGEAEFDELLAGFPDVRFPEARRAIVVVDVVRIADACGYGVPLMDLAGHRDHADAWTENKLRKGGPAALDAYRREKNARSIDGLPAVDPPPEVAAGDTES